MSYTAGQKVVLSKAALYVSSTASKKAGTVTGTYYLWSASVVNGRIRITNKTSNVGRTPAGTYVTGWINTSSITTTSDSTASSSGTANTSGTSSSTKTTTTSNTSPSSKANMTVVNSNVSASDVTPTGTTAGQIGYLGKVIFLVSSSQIKTITNFAMETSAQYKTHDLHGAGQMVEYTGYDAETVSFSVLLSKYLGTDPWADYETWRKYCREGTAVPLKLGTKTYGDYRWVIEKLSFTGEYTDKKGNWTQATVKLTLMAYEKR